MEMLRLTLEELQVQSFATDEPEGSQRGTVRGYGATENEAECATVTCYYTCDETCGDSCEQCNNHVSWWVTAGYSGCGYCDW
jgi:hypothetical protein